VGTTFAASITLPNVIKVAGHEVPGVFTTAMFGKKGQNMTDEIKNLTLNMKIDPPSRPPTRDGEQGGAVTLKGDTLTQPQKGGDITLQWGDAPGDFPPDKTSAR
jgi:hypothetical protein